MPSLKPFLVLLMAGSAFAQSASPWATVPKPPWASSGSGPAPSSHATAPKSNYDLDGEQQLLELANQARAQAGVPPLKMDEGLAKAARAHTAVMATHHQISHDFSGEPALPQRLAATSSLLLSGEGENVGYTQSVSSAHTGFMNSPHHRENLLDPDFNVVGFGIVHAGGMVYVTQDFARSLPNYSPDHARSLVTQSVQQGRSQAGTPELEQKDNAAADSAACAMAQADSLSAPAPAAHYIVRFTTLQPQELPDKAHAALADPAVKSYSAGVCYKRTQSYPQGAYWVILLFY